MYHDLGSVITKALGYVPELDWRVKWLDKDHVLFEGRHHQHGLERKNSQWNCDCPTYKSFAAIGAGICPHSKAMMYPEINRIDGKPERRV